MNEGYLIVKCYRCGSTSQLVMKGVRGTFPVCPVCYEGEVECQAIQTTIQMCQEFVDGIQKLNPYIATFAKLSTN